MFLSRHYKDQKKPNMSVIAEKEIISKNSCYIGIYYHGNSRNIYIEYGSDTKKLFHYEIFYKNGYGQSDASGGWIGSEIICGEINKISYKLARLKEDSDKFTQIKCSQEDAIMFKEKMDQYSKEEFILFGEHDDQLKDVVGKLSSSCTIEKSSDSKSDCVLQ